MVEVVADARGVEIDAVGGGHVKMLRQVLQPEAFELAARDIVVLRENPGVDEAAAADVVAAVRDRALGDLQARGARAHLAAVAPERELHPMAPGARFEVFEVEAEQVVALDHVGVALGDDPHQLLEHRALVHLVAAHHVLVSRPSR